MGWGTALRLSRKSSPKFSASSPLTASFSKRREKMTWAATANERVLKRLAAHRILLALSISYAAGALTVLALKHLLPAMLSYFFTASGPGL
jgi:hypothetical protein